MNTFPKSDYNLLHELYQRVSPTTKSVLDRVFKEKKPGNVAMNPSTLKPADSNINSLNKNEAICI